MNFIEEGIRLKQVLDERTSLTYAQAWETFADQGELLKYNASMLLLCEESGIKSLLPAQNQEDIHKILIGMKQT